LSIIPNTTIIPLKRREGGGALLEKAINDINKKEREIKTGLIDLSSINSFCKKMNFAWATWDNIF